MCVCVCLPKNNTKQHKTAIEKADKCCIVAPWVCILQAQRLPLAISRFTSQRRNTVVTATSVNSATAVPVLFQQLSKQLGRKGDFCCRKQSLVLKEIWRTLVEQQSGVSACCSHKGQRGRQRQFDYIRGISKSEKKKISWWLVRQLPSSTGLVTLA